MLAKRKYSHEQEQFCIEFKKMGKKNREIMDLFEEIFETSLPEGSLKNILQRNDATITVDVIFKPWMEEYIKKEYKDSNDLKKIAKHLKLKTIQVNNKISAMGLRKSKGLIESDSLMDDAEKLISKIDSLKKNIHVGSKVTVKYNKYAELDSNKNNRKNKDHIAEVSVVGVYPNFVNVLIDGFKSSYSYDDILEVL